MEVHLTADLTAKLNALASATGRAPDELAADAIAGYIDGLMDVRAELDRRYDDHKSGKVKPVDGEEAFARLRARGAIRRAIGPSRQLTAP